MSKQGGSLNATSTLISHSTPYKTSQEIHNIEQPSQTKINSVSQITEPLSPTKIETDPFNEGIYRTLLYGIETYNNNKQRFNKQKGRKQKVGKQKRGKQKGGVILDVLAFSSAQGAFLYFIENSVATHVINSSLSGIIIILKLKDNDDRGDSVQSPYTSYNTQSILEKKPGNVKRLCIKLVKFSNRVQISDYSNPSFNGKLGSVRNLSCEVGLNQDDLVPSTAQALVDVDNESDAQLIPIKNISYIKEHYTFRQVKKLRKIYQIL